jgi:dTDP-4-amino-4,6-dideoxygalactose transaminase
VDQIRAVLSDRTSAIIVTHVAGRPVDIDPILALAAERGVPVLEDCAQAHGAEYKGRMVGSLGTISAFSTMFSKHHATGAQGGVVFTKDRTLFETARRIADRGKPFGIDGNPGNVVASLNFNQDEISMAIGRVQLERLPAALVARRKFVRLVEQGLHGFEGVTLIGDPSGCAGAHLFLMLRLDRATLRCDSQEFAAALQREGIDDVHAGYPVYPTDQPWHQHAAVFGSSGLPWSMVAESKPRRFELPNAREANLSIVRVDVHESLGAREAKDLVAAIKKIAGHLTKR